MDAVSAGNAVSVLGRSISALNVIVVPSEFLVGLNAGQEVRFGEIEDGYGQETSSNKIDGVMMGEVHGRPP